jgi:hypothetical protein
MTNTVWKGLPGCAVLVFFAALGMAHILYPDRFMKPWHRGGEMLTDLNRLGIRVAGGVLTAATLYILYNLIRG